MSRSFLEATALPFRTRTGPQVTTLLPGVGRPEAHRQRRCPIVVLKAYNTKRHRRREKTISFDNVRIHGKLVG